MRTPEGQNMIYDIPNLYDTILEKLRVLADSDIITAYEASTLNMRLRDCINARLLNCKPAVSCYGPVPGERLACYFIAPSVRDGEIKAPQPQGELFHARSEATESEAVPVADMWLHTMRRTVLYLSVNHGLKSIMMGCRSEPAGLIL